jgi:hypothetical protein
VQARIPESRQKPTTLLCLPRRHAPLASNGRTGSVARACTSPEIGQQVVRGEEGMISVLQVFVHGADRHFDVGDRGPGCLV